MDLIAVANVTEHLGRLRDSVASTNLALDTVWVIVAAILVMLMQAGFAFLEMGFSRQKNVGTVVAKVLMNFSICAVVFWACGFAFGFSGSAGSVIGDTGFFLNTTDVAADFPGLAFSAVGISAKWFFEFVFCAVSLAIVWGTTLERIKFSVYAIYAIVFSAIIYPLIAHWLFAFGWLAANLGSQDFAGSTVVHLSGATGALAVLLLLGPRRGKYGPDGKPNVIPGHSMPFVGLATFILWFGWFGFNPGSTLSALSSTGQNADIRFADIVLVTNIAAACGVIGALLTIYAKTRKPDIGMACNGAIAALVAITAPSGYVNPWAATIIGFVAGVIVVVGVLLIDKVLDDPVGALSAHGLAGIWGTLACGLFTDPALATLNGVGEGGLVYTGSFHQLWAQFVAVCTAFGTVFALSFATFFAIKATIGLRVRPEEESYGLDMAEHGMWGYPEQFMPVPGYEYHQPAPPSGRPAPRPAPVGLGAEGPP
jgi:ammonium transporter, Amt family